MILHASSCKMWAKKMKTQYLLSLLMCVIECHLKAFHFCKQSALNGYGAYFKLTIYQSKN